ncbi:MAG: hypothetical protein P8H36_09095, partial [Yoonia sp.]|nr:hypothetical protein [Yoonia sp.]
CELHNMRIFDVLELSGGDIGIGTKRSDFLALAEKRGEFAAAAQAEATAKFKSHKPFSFDHKSQARGSLAPMPARRAAVAMSSHSPT